MPRDKAKSAIRILLAKLNEIGKQLPKETNPVYKALGVERKQLHGN